MSLCIRCGSYKQAPSGVCRCGFKPLRGSLDEAKSFVLSTQFRSPESLEASAEAVRAGQVIMFSERELKLAQRIGSWNAAVTLSFLASAVCLGFFIGAVVARSSLWVLTALSCTAAAAFACAFALMRLVDRMVQAVRTPNTGDCNESGA